MVSAAPIVRILSLDAPAYEPQAGFAQMEMIRAVMREIWKQRYGSEPSEKDINGMIPADYFARSFLDWIYGSGTGGALAVYLGRLHKTIGECEELYDQLGRGVYARPISSFNPLSYNYDHASLESVLKTQTGGFDNFIDYTIGCRSVVLTYFTDNLSKHHAITSRDPCNRKVWEVIRASIASYYDFPPVKIGTSRLFAADAHCSNPSMAAWEGARDHYAPKKEKIIKHAICLVSIGGGHRPSIQLHAKGVPSPCSRTQWWIYWVIHLLKLVLALFLTLIGRFRCLQLMQALMGVGSDSRPADDAITKKFSTDRETEFERHFIWKESAYFRFNFNPDEHLNVMLYRNAWDLARLFRGLVIMCMQTSHVRWDESKSRMKRITYRVKRVGPDTPVGPMEDMAAKLIPGHSS